MNEFIRAVLNFLLFFLRKDILRTKKHKKASKSTKSTKSTKNTKKHKNVTKQKQKTQVSEQK